MAQATVMHMSEVPLLEEHVETGLQELMDSYRTNYVPGGELKDSLNDRFTLYPSRELPEFHHAYAKAYEAHDNFNASRTIYGLVCDNTMPVRSLAISELTGFAHPNVVSILGSGTVNCSHLGESRHVIFVERPRGSRLSEVTKAGMRMHEHKVLDLVIQPILKVITELRSSNISHGHIHPGNIYMSDSLQLGEYVSQPCGLQAHYLYEPLERLLADPLGRGEATEKSDVYALGILAYELIYGLNKIKTLPKDAFLLRVVDQGAYSIFSNGREFSDMYQDFFRGVLNENPSERWGVEQLAQWISGKRFNMIAPTALKEAVRPIEFMGESFFSRRTLAYSFQTHWRQALKDIRSLKLDRWCEMSLNRNDIAEKLERNIRLAGHGSTDAQLNDVLTRVVSILDPVGPLRSLHVSLRPDAIGTVLADVIKHNGPELAQITSYIETDISNFWVEQSDINKSPEMSIAIWRIQRSRPYLKTKAMGFGLERLLYDLNPSLSCQSPILKQYHITTSSDALKTLDAIAHTLGPDTSFADRHIAAFVASKIDMTKEIRFNDLSNIRELVNNQELIVMKLLAKAQQKNTKLKLVGLCTWAAMRSEKMIDTIHNRIIRKRLKLQLKKLALTGDLYEVMTAVINADVTHHDQEGFVKAIALHQFNHERINRLKNEDILEYKAKRAGGKMAMIISYIALIVTSYVSITNNYNI